MSEDSCSGDALGDLYTGFDSYRVLAKSDIENALRDGILALDANVLLNLYRYNDKTVDDLLRVVAAAAGRVFVPHQVIREFWRNRQSVIAGLGSASKDAQAAMQKNATSTKDAIARWAKSIALPRDEHDALDARVDEVFKELKEKVGYEPPKVSAHTPTSEDMLLARLEDVLRGSVGPALSEEDWQLAVDEGERRVLDSIPPGYMDSDKLESDLPERASGDYLVWNQLNIEGRKRGVDLVLVTADVKEDWWNRGVRDAIVGPRRELIEEYLAATGCRFFILDPADLIKYSSALEVSTDPDSVRDIERVRDEDPRVVPWTLDAVTAVLKELDVQGHTQADVIREAAANGGKISRERVYAIDNRDKAQTLRGFTKPVRRVTSELQARGGVPYGVSALLDAIYETGVKTSHFAVPQEVVVLFAEQP